jgi:5'-3' exonuclease
MSLLIIDSDHLSHRMAASCEPTKSKLHREPLTTAISRIEATINHVFNACGSKTYEMYLAGQDNFRKTLYPAYKANRTGKESPMWLEDCREYLVCEWGAKIVNGMEVDDMCGIRMSSLHAESPVCVSLDKDLLQIPGNHYNFVNQEFKQTTPLDGLRIFYKQIILGDASDNVPGYDGKFRSSCPKFIKAMQDPLDEMTEESDMYEHVCSIYQTTTEDWEATVLLHGQLLYCLRAEEQMWQAPKRNQQQ